MTIQNRVKDKDPWLREAAQQARERVFFSAGCRLKEFIQYTPEKLFELKGEKIPAHLRLLLTGNRRIEQSEGVLDLSATFFKHMIKERPEPLRAMARKRIRQKGWPKISQFTAFEFFLYWALSALQRSTKDEHHEAFCSTLAEKPEIGSFLYNSMVKDWGSKPGYLSPLFFCALKNCDPDVSIMAMRNYPYVPRERKKEVRKALEDAFDRKEPSVKLYAAWCLAKYFKLRKGVDYLFSVAECEDQEKALQAYRLIMRVDHCRREWQEKTKKVQSVSEFLRENDQKK
jgi:hypothetical protein